MDITSATTPFQFPQNVDELRWQPVGTCKNDPTMPSDTPIVSQKLLAKAFVHDCTALEAAEGFLVLEVGDEEAIVGPLRGEKTLGDLFKRRRPVVVSLSCCELLHLVEDEDPTEADKELIRSLKSVQAKDIKKGDEEAIFFRDLCSYINDRNLYTTDSSNSSKDNTSLSKEN